MIIISIWTVKAIGSEVSKFSIGQKAGVGVYVDSCRSCANCLIRESNYCLEGMTGTYNAKGINILLNIIS